MAGILLKGSSILLGKRSADRSFYPNVWDLFGGHVESGEELDEALTREFQEELGIVPTEFSLLDLLSEPNVETHGPHKYFIYQVNAWDGSPLNLLEEEHSEIRWFTLEDATSLSLAHPDYPRIFRQLQTEPNKPEHSMRAIARAGTIRKSSDWPS